MAGAGPYVRIFNALKAARVPEAEAADAADAMMALKDDEIHSIRGDVKELRKDVSDIRGDLKAQKVEMRIIGAMVFAILVRLFFPNLFH